MSTQTSAPAFELARFCRAVEGRDVATQVAMYADDAEVTIADRINQPGSPQVLRGREQVAEWIRDICGRDMSHSVRHAVADDRGAAFSEACRYPDGTNVLCATVMELSGGQIARQTVVQAWDES
jgi:ketosteroid isomerase-like protein